MSKPHPGSIAFALSLALLASPPAQAGVTLDDASGRVEVLSGGAGKGSGILPGEPLPASALLATGEGSKAVLAVDDGSRLVLGAQCKVTVQAAKATEIRLEQGSVVAELAAHARPLELRAGENPAVIRAGEGKLSVALERDGAITVTARDATLTSKGQSFKVAGDKPFTVPADGQLPQTAVAVAAEPAALAEPAADAKPKAAPLPPQLSVSWPEGTQTRADVALRGSATPGSALRVNGEKVRLRKDGTFRTTLHLSAGEHPIEVRATADGLETTAMGKVVVTLPAAPRKAAPLKAPDAEEATDAAPAKPAAKPQAKKAAKPEGEQSNVKQEDSGWE